VNIVVGLQLSKHSNPKICLHKTFVVNCQSEAENKIGSSMTTSFELNDLPIELLSIVFTYTGGLFPLTTAKQVCKQWYQDVNATSEELWMTLFRQQFPETVIVMEQLHHAEEVNNVAIEPMNHRNEFVKKAEQLFKRRREIFDSARDSIGTEFVKELLSDKWMKDARFAFGHQLKLIGTEMSEDKIPVGYSKTGGTPDFPLDYELKLSSPENAVFLFQINLDHASFFIEPGVLLPKRGMLYVYVVTHESDRADVFYLSPSEIKQFGGLIRKDPNQHKEKDDEYSRSNKAASAILEFGYTFSFSEFLEDEEFPEFTSEQVDFIRTGAQKYHYNNLDYFREIYKKLSFSLLGSYEPECNGLRFEVTDEYITEANFNGMKIVSLDQLLPENEQSADVSKLLEQYNADHPEDQYEVAFKETHDTNAWFYSKERGLAVNDLDFDVKYLLTPVEKRIPICNRGLRFHLSTSSNDQISKRDGLRDHILFMKQSLYDQCKQREPAVIKSRKVLERKMRVAARQEEEEMKQAELEGKSYNSKRPYIHSFRSGYSDLLYCKYPAWKPKMRCFVQWFTNERIGLKSSRQTWELFMRQGQYLKDNGDYDFNCIQVRSHKCKLICFFCLR
jgi:hypothetical protein